MARYRMAAMRPVNRIKHVVDSQNTITKNNVLVIPIADTTDTPTLAATQSVETGSKINGIYLRVEVASNDPIDIGVIPNCYMYVAKNPGNNLTLPNPSAVGASDAKRYVIHQEMSMIENKGQGSNPRTLFNGVIAIPRGYRRNGPDDLLQVSIFCEFLDIAACIQCHYKEFR